MFNQTKNIVCPRCRKKVGQKLVEYRKDERPVWALNDEIEADFICSDCRKKIEEDIKRRAKK